VIDFDTLLFPMDADDFWLDHFERAPLLLRGPSPRRFESLFTFDSLNRVLNLTDFPHRGLRLIENGRAHRPRDRAWALAACQRGATILVYDIHRSDEALARFAAGLALQLGGEVKVNLYYSQEKQQGFTTHFDTHDVLVLQVEGSKRWRVFADRVPFPLSQYPGGPEKPRVPPRDPLLECVLEPGDVLYIPRGYWHDALAVNGHSLHLTTGLYPRTGFDFLQWWTRTLITDARFRIALPPGPTTDPATLDAWRVCLSKLTDILRAQLDDPGALAADYQRFNTRLLRRPAFRFPTLAEGVIEDASADGPHSVPAAPESI
jgi:ribosomal protein L16 Arg81 hydroxylase